VVLLLGGVLGGEVMVPRVGGNLGTLSKWWVMLDGGLVGVLDAFFSRGFEGLGCECIGLLGRV